MSEQWTTGVRDGYRTKVIRVGNCTVEINRPILSDDVRESRERAVTAAMERYVKHMISLE